MGKVGTLALSIFLVSGCVTEPSMTPRLSSSAPAVPAAQPPRLGKGFPSTVNFLRPEWIKSGNTGSALIHACVGPDGKLTEDPRIEKSSGSERFDRGAIALAEAGSGHYEPAMKDGHPVAQCFLYWVSIRVTGS